jgi:hypothetical protein
LGTFQLWSFGIWVNYSNLNLGLQMKGFEINRSKF